MLDHRVSVHLVRAQLFGHARLYKFIGKTEESVGYRLTRTDQGLML